MARPREFDEEKVLAAVLETFRERGFEATSLADLTGCTRLHKGSLYGAFGDKRRLFRTALERYQAESLADLARDLSAGPSPRAALRAYFGRVVERCAAKSGPQGCLCVNSAVELAPRDDELARLLRKHFERVEALFQDAVERGQARREFARGLDAAAAGRFLSTLLQGLAVLARMRPSRARLVDVVEVGLAALDP
jgi:TetR/AcrR family transcriptional repressor of nem operon